MPGWYGVGSGIAEVIKDATSKKALKQLYKEWSFFTAIVNNAQREMARANLIVSQLYSDADQSFHIRIAEEFERAQHAILQITGQQDLLAVYPVIQKSIRLRNPYTDVLNLLQVEMMQRWKDADAQERIVLRSLLFSSINGIAAAMQSTG